MPNFSSSLFESFIVDYSDNPFSILDSSVATSAPSTGPPISCSSPSASRKNLLDINLQSVENTKEELCSLLDSANTNLIMGTETWLNPIIHSSEVLPSNYDIIRHDRADENCGALLAVRND